MGRTNPTFRDLLRAVETRWDDYRRALRHDDQQHYDQLFEYAAEHADAAGYLNPSEPTHPILLSMLLEQQKAIHRLEERVATLERAADDRGTTADRHP